MRCIGCHYSLKHLTEHRCPECGREFDPKRPSTFEHENKQKAPLWVGDRRSQAKVGMALAVVTIAGALGRLVYDDQSRDEAAYYFLAGIGGVAVFYMMLKKLNK